MLQNTDILIILAKMIEDLGLDNAKSFFQIWSPIPILPSVGNASIFLTLWTLRSALLGGNRLPIGHPPQILLSGARALDKIIRYIVPCHLAFEIQMNFAIFVHDFYYIINIIGILQDSNLIYEILNIRIPNLIEKINLQLPFRCWKQRVDSSI